MKKIKLNNGMEMKRMLLCILVCLITTSAFCAEKLPLSMYGVVYDVGLMFGGKNLSVSNFRKEQVVYDMSIIKHVLNCNTVRIEGENLDRLSIATEEAHKQGLKVLFNPWKMEADSATTVDYMIRASKVAEKLRLKGADLIFVTGCEYTLFNRGVFPGDTFDKRIAWAHETRIYAKSDGGNSGQETQPDITVNGKPSEEKLPWKDCLLFWGLGNGRLDEFRLCWSRLLS